MSRDRCRDGATCPQLHFVENGSELTTRFAVDTLTADDGQGTASSTVVTQYTYVDNNLAGEGGSVGDDGGFLGFYSVSIRHYERGSTTSVLRQEWVVGYKSRSDDRLDPRRGKVFRRETRTAGGTTLASTETDWVAYWYTDTVRGVGNVNDGRWEWAERIEAKPQLSDYYPPTWLRVITTTTVITNSVVITNMTLSLHDATLVGAAAQFGNVAEVQEHGDGVLLRRTLTTYAPNTARHIVNLPARVLVYNGAGGCLAETRHVYGIGNVENGYLTAPTTPHLVKTEQMLTGGCPSGAATIGKYDAAWAITRYAYDAWGNQTTVNRLGADASKDLAFTTVWDDSYHLFPVEQFYVAESTYKETTQYYGVGGALGVSDSKAYWGRLQEWCGVNGVCTRQSWDLLGRRKRQWTHQAWGGPWPADSAAAVQWSYYPPGANAGQSTFMVEEWRAPRCYGNLTRTFYNGFGQLLSVHTSSQDWTTSSDNGAACGVAAGGHEIHTYYAYDGLGRQTKVSIPTLHARWPDPDWVRATPTTWPAATVTAYDALDRPTLATAPNGVQTRWAYNTRASYSYLDDPDSSENRMLRWTKVDALGNLVGANNYNWAGSWTLDGYVSMAYDATGNLKTVTNVGGVATTMTYDMAGRKLSLSDPNLGSWQYAYDRQGRLTRQQDAKGNVTCLYYDGLERLTDKQFSTGSETCPAAARAYNTAHSIRFVYDTSGAAKGQLKESSRYGEGPTLWSTNTLAYDTLGRLSGQTVVLGSGLSATTSYGYDAWSRPSTTTYPDGEVLTLAYNGMGLPALLSSSVEGVIVGGTSSGAGRTDLANFDAAGRLTKALLPADNSTDLWRTLTYAPYTSTVQGGLLSHVQVGTAGNLGASVALTYTWDAFGNVVTLKEGALAPTSFEYDDQRRVTSAYGKLYSYWPSGRFSKYEAITNTVTYGDGVSEPYHAVVSTSAGGQFSYDAAGNMTARTAKTGAPQQTMGWTPANELRWVAVGGVLNESYRYDPDGERILRAVAGGAVQYIYFPHYETSVQDGVTTATRSYFLNGQRFAQKVGSGSVTYLHSDHLGSTVLTTEASGSQRYDAYGNTRSGSVPTEWQYTGQEQDGTGLVYLHARYYDPATGIFISPDTIVPDPTGVFDYNRYMYARGNPLKFVDPSGHQASCSMDQNLNITCGDNSVIGGITYDLDPEFPHPFVENGERDLYLLFGAMAAVALAPAAVYASIGVMGSSVTAIVGEVGGTAGTVGAVACADGDCSNEVTTATSLLNGALKIGAQPIEAMTSMTKIASQLQSKDGLIGITASGNMTSLANPNVQEGLAVLNSVASSPDRIWAGTWKGTPVYEYVQNGIGVVRDQQTGALVTVLARKSLEVLERFVENGTATWLK